MIRAIIIDNEKHCCDNLQWQLDQYCPQINVVAMCYNAEEGLKQIRRLRPQLTFLDVEMPSMTGFEMLEELNEIDFGIIFTTAFDQYAIRAIKFGALSYLLKPIDKDELLDAVKQFEIRTQQDSIKQLKALLNYLKKNNDFALQKIALPTLHGYELVALDDIMICESKSNYTDIKLNNGQHLLISRTLKQIAELLNMLPFFRIHNSYLVNLYYAIRYIKGEGGILVLTNDVTLPVSRHKKEELINLITHLPS